MQARAALFTVVSISEVFSVSNNTTRAVISIMKEALRAPSKKAGLELEKQRDRKRA